MWNIQILIAALIIAAGLLVSVLASNSGDIQMGKMIAIGGAVAGGWLLVRRFNLVRGTNDPLHLVFTPTYPRNRSSSSPMSSAHSSASAFSSA